MAAVFEGLNLLSKIKRSACRPGLARLCGMAWALPARAGTV